MRNKFTQSLLALFLSIAVQAQSGGTFIIEDKVIGGGGGASAAESFAVESTIGQGTAGTNSAGEDFSVNSGYWANSAAPVGISGTITYGNSIGNPVPSRFVRNVSLSSTAGSPPVGPVITGTPGTYTLTGFGSGSYTIRPTKTGGA